MMSLPAGGFVPKASPLRRLDARAKLLCLILLLAVSVGAASPSGYALALAAAGCAAALSELPLRLTLAPLRGLWSFFLVIFLMNALFFDGPQPLWSWWIFRLTETGIRQGLQVTARTALVVVFAGLLTLTTPPMEITAAIEALLRPLKLLSVPTGDAAMILGTAIRFVPVLSEEAGMIRMAQTARGARFESRKLSEKAESFLPLVVPIFISAFRRADELSLAMEARGYRGAGGRTPKKSEPLRARDCAAPAVCAAACAVQFLLLR